MKDWILKIKKNWFKAYFALAMAMVLVVFGVEVGTYKYFPYELIKSAREAALDWINNYKHYTKIRPEKLIYPSRHDGEGVAIHVPEKSYDGVTFITSLWGNVLGMNLVESDGAVIHEWRVSYSDIFPEEEANYTRRLAVSLGDWDSHIHGAVLYPNGDVVFNFEYGGIAKIDKCSNVIWKLPYITHHSIYKDAEGYLWVPGRKTLNKSVKRLPLLRAPIEEEFILKISPDGEILKEISILDVFYNSGQEAFLSADGIGEVKRFAGDITHMNDIDILEESISDQFPLFEAGDIMVSLRHLNLIVIIDSTMETIKWSMTGPYIRQHDPDFLENGHISVFDNRNDDTNSGEVLGGSRILSIDPVTRKITITYKGDDQNSFYTAIMGKHQYLPNGNILITESLAGRAFETAPTGQVVWAYINRLNDDEVYLVEEATRYPKEYAEFAGGTGKCH